MGKLEELEAQFQAARTALAEWKAGPGPAKLKAAKEAQIAADKAEKKACDAYRDEELAAAIRAGIRKARGGPRDVSEESHPYTQRFLDAVAAHVGASYEEREKIPQANIGGRTSGPSLYGKALQHLEDRIIAADSALVAAKKVWDAAREKEREADLAFNDAQREENKIKWAVGCAEREILDYHNAHKMEEEARAARKAKIEEKGGKEEAARFKRAKERLLHIMGERETRGYSRFSKVEPLPVVAIWPPKIKAVKP